MLKHHLNIILKVLTENNTCGYGIRYISVGAWNTVFGLCIYTLLMFILGDEHYLLLGIISHTAAVTNAFCGYKFIVFKSKGNWLKEYFKCHIVYSGGLLTGMILMFAAVTIFGFDAIISNLVLTPLLWILNFLGHKFFSFKNKKRCCSENVIWKD